MEDKLTEEERALFNSLSEEKSPPAELEDKVIAALNEKNLLNKTTMRTSKKKLWTIGIATSILLFTSGYILGNLGGDEISSGYVMILHEDEDFKPVGTEMEMFTEYATWMGKMMLDGISITGKELAPESTFWVGEASSYTPVSTLNNRTSGYFIIDVKSQKEAEKIAASSPHIKFGGTVELIKLSERN